MGFLTARWPISAPGTSWQSVLPPLPRYSLYRGDSAPTCCQLWCFDRGVAARTLNPWKSQNDLGSCRPPGGWPRASSFRSGVFEAWAGGVRWRSQLRVAGQDSLAPPSPLAVASESGPLGGRYVFNSLSKWLKYIKTGRGQALSLRSKRPPFLIYSKPQH